ncbi:hypothetical protein BLNAU_4690 [Blattamonas nauphoetae]|uniref:Uncharacterized protein n=1 Tax=Blattamonas nauphoetae TaxID=2049346 RepID=A0ABQ9Y9U7_9EUKA|nr:hypothetical protein BLNAU_4690 [Blattamonas nauphoetae]
MFVSTKRIVNELGGLKLRGKARFDWENKQRVQRGGIPIPSPKTPYKILQGMIKKQKERNEKSIKKALEQGITPPKKHLTTTKKALRQRDRTGPDPHRGLTTSLGRYKKGILHIDKELIRQTESSSTNTDRKKARPAQKPQTKGKKKGKKWK